MTAEVIANELKLPIILIGKRYDGINKYITEIPQDVTIFVDEYEKVFKGAIDEDDYDAPKEGDSTLLSLMDGTYKTEFRRVFLLTTNRTWINDNMLNRPGRIRYLKEFSDLNLEQINEIIDDALVNKDWRESIIKYLQPLKIITVDIVKAVVSEVNVFDEAPEVCCKHLNVEFKEDEYDVYEVAEGRKKDVLTFSAVPRKQINHIISMTPGMEGHYLHLNESTYRLAKGGWVVNKEKMIFKVEDIANPKKITLFRLQKTPPMHSSFKMNVI